MKKTIKGILYDSSKATPLCCSVFQAENQRVSETAYRTNSGQYFIVQVIDGKETALFPVSNTDMAAWTEFHSKRMGKLWPGPKK